MGSPKPHRNYDGRYLDVIADILAEVKQESYRNIPSAEGELKLLDLGCGTGIDCTAMDGILRERGAAYRIWGVDIEPIFLYQFTWDTILLEIRKAGVL